MLTASSDRQKLINLLMTKEVINFDSNPWYYETIITFLVKKPELFRYIYQNNRALIDLLIDKGVINRYYFKEDITFLVKNLGFFRNIYQKGINLLELLIKKKIINDCSSEKRIILLAKNPELFSNSNNRQVLEFLIDHKIIAGWNFKEITEVLVENKDLLSINMGLLERLIDKNILQNKSFLEHLRNQPSIVKTILKTVDIQGDIDNIIKSISENIIKNSGNLVRNCYLALVLYQKGIVKNITIDYLFDSKKIQTDIDSTIEFTDGGGGESIDLTSGIFCELSTADNEK